MPHCPSLIDTSLQGRRTFLRLAPESKRHDQLRHLEVSTPHSHPRKTQRCLIWRTKAGCGSKLNRNSHRDPEFVANPSPRVYPNILFFNKKRLSYKPHRDSMILSDPSSELTSPTYAKYPFPTFAPTTAACA